MALIETLTPERVRASWEEEIDEVLSVARPTAGHWAADPDWQAAADFLVRHCREALAGRWVGGEPVADLMAPPR